MSNYKILYTCFTPFGFPSEDAGGGSSHVYGVINALESRGFEVITFPNKKEVVTLWEIKKIGSLHRNIFRNLLRDLYIIFILNTFYFLKLLHFRNESLIIYNRFTNYSWSIALFAFLFNKDMINEINAPIEEAVISGNGSILNPLNKYLLLIISRLSKLNVCVSESLRKILIDYGTNPKNVVFHPNCVNTDFLKSVNNDRISEIKIKHNISDDNIVFGMVAQFQQWHGVEQLLKVLENYHDKKIVKLLLVGNPAVKYHETFHKVINETSVDVIHVGFVNHKEVKHYIDVMDVCIELGRLNNYGSPLKLIEYGARGKLVIIQETEPVKEIITHGENGLLVNKKNVKSVALSTIDEFDHESAPYKLMGKRLKALVHSKYTWDKYIDFIDERTDCLLSHGSDYFHVST